MNNPLYTVLWENICKSDEEMKDLIENRNTVLQLVLVECVDKPGKFILLANTHLFFHPAADFIRLIQSVVSAKHIESILHTLVSDENKNATVLFAGDFNSDPPSYAIQYLFTQQLPLNGLPPGLSFRLLAAST
jgi:2',5'-phosphodiesterase